MKAKPKMIGISESSLQINKQPINNISLPNYIYEHTPTESGKGDTLPYIDQNLKYKVRGDLNIYIKSLIESTFIEIMNTKQKNMIIGCIYKHPKQGTHDFNENYTLPLMDKLSREKTYILIMGDFNINLLNYSNDKDTTIFLDRMFSNSFSPLITLPTRVSNNSETLLDNIFYKKPLNNDMIAGNLCFVISNHFIQFLVQLSSYMQNSSKEKITKRCCKKFDKERFKYYLEKVKWQKHFNNLDPNVSMEHCLNIVHTLLDRHAPFKSFNKKPNTYSSKP